MADIDVSTQPGTEPAVQPQAAIADNQSAAAEPVIAADPQKIDLKTIDDDTRLKLLNETLGTSYKTLGEAKPKIEKSKEEVEADKKAKTNKVIEWAFGTGKVTRDQYDLAIAEKSKNPRDIALALFAKEQREENAKITDEQINAEFSDFYREEEDMDSPLRKKALKLMDKTVNEYLKQVTGPIENIEADYDSYQSTEQKYTGYEKLVKTVASTLPKEILIALPYKGVDGTESTIEYKIPVEDSVIAAVRKEFANANTFYAIGADSKDIKDADLATEMSAAIEARILRKAIPSILKQHEERVEQDMTAKLKNIPNTQPNFNTGGGPKPGEKREPPTYPALKKNQERNGVRI